MEEGGKGSSRTEKDRKDLNGSKGLRNRIKGKAEKTLDDAKILRDRIKGSAEKKLDDAKILRDRIKGSAEKKLDDAKILRDRIKESAEKKLDDARDATNQVAEYLNIRKDGSNRFMDLKEGLKAKVLGKKDKLQKLKAEDAARILYELDKDNTDFNKVNDALGRLDSALDRVDRGQVENQSTDSAWNEVYRAWSEVHKALINTGVTGFRRYIDILEEKYNLFYQNEMDRIKYQREAEVNEVNDEVFRLQKMAQDRIDAMDSAKRDAELQVLRDENDELRAAIAYEAEEFGELLKGSEIDEEEPEADRNMREKVKHNFISTIDNLVDQGRIDFGDEYSEYKNQEQDNLQDSNPGISEMGEANPDSSIAPNSSPNNNNSEKGQESGIV